MIWEGEVEVDPAPELERKPRSVRRKSRETVRMGRKRELVRHRLQQRQVLDPEEGSCNQAPQCADLQVSLFPCWARLLSSPASLALWAWYCESGAQDKSRLYFQWLQNHLTLQHKNASVSRPMTPNTDFFSWFQQLALQCKLLSKTQLLSA